MSLWQIAWRSIRQRWLASTLTTMSMALGVALAISVLAVLGSVNKSFTQGSVGYDLIVGAKGDRLQLVLNTIYHLSSPVENIPYSYYKEFTREMTPAGERVGKFAADVEWAIPFCLGDNYEGFRVVGTTPQIFEVPYGLDGEYRFAEGRNFETPNFFEGVVGSLVAAETGLKVGDQFEPTHGVSNEVEGHKHDAFTVVGVLESTGTPNDRALFINLEGFYLLRGHAKEDLEPPKPPSTTSSATEPAALRSEDVAGHAHDEHAAEEHAHDEDAHVEHVHEEGAHEDGSHDGHEHEEDHPHSADAADSHDHDHGRAGEDHEHGHAHAHEPLPEEKREVTAVLVRRKSDNIARAMGMQKRINKDNVAQGVLPLSEIVSLFETFVNPIRTLLIFLAVLIIVEAGIGILVSIYNSMNERKREIAIMRSLGASRSIVMAIVMLESVMLSLAGGFIGFVFAHGVIGLASPLLESRIGVSIGFFDFSEYEFWLLPGLIVLAALVGYLPALNAYRTDVAKALSASP